MVCSDKTICQVLTFLRVTSRRLSMRRIAFVRLCELQSISGAIMTSGISLSIPPGEIMDGKGRFYHQSTGKPMTAP